MDTRDLPKKEKENELSNLIVEFNHIIGSISNFFEDNDDIINQLDIKKIISSFKQTLHEETEKFDKTFLKLENESLSDKDNEKKTKISLKSKNKYGNICEYKNHMAIVTSRYKKGSLSEFNTGKKGAIDEQGNEVIECKYVVLKDFNKYGFAIASLDGRKYGIINTKGEVVVPFEFDAIHSVIPDIYFDGYNYGGKHTIFDSTNCHKTKYTRVEWNNEFLKLDKYIYGINSKKILNYKFDDFFAIGNIYIGVTQNQSRYYDSIDIVLYDNNFEEIDKIDDIFKYEIIDNNLLITTNDFRYAVINIFTKTYIPVKKYTNCKTTFDNDIIFHNKKNAKKSSLFINCQGQTITIPNIFAENITEMHIDDNTIHLDVELEANNGYYVHGIYNTDGKEIIPIAYYRIFKEDNCYIVVDTNGKIGFTSFDGTVIIKPQYIDIKTISDNRYLVTNDEKKRFLVDLKGNTSINLTEYIDNNEITTTKSHKK